MNQGKRFTAGCILLMSALLFAGCVTNKNTITPRSATEQLLLSTAADHALSNTNAALGLFAGRHVYLDSSYFDSYDSKYVIGTIRDCLSRAGAYLVDNPTNSDVVIEARSGALAMNQSDTMFGIPAITIPMPLTGTVQTPEVAFYKAEKQLTYAKFALFARNEANAAHIYSSGSLDGKSYDKHFRLIFISWERTDVSEIQDPKKIMKYRTWFPQYDPTNLPNAVTPSTNTPAK